MSGPQGQGRVEAGEQRGWLSRVMGGSLVVEMLCAHAPSAWSPQQ